MNPKISLVAWEARNPTFIFVAVPNERGRYVRTDPSVALVSCPDCEAIRGEPCKFSQGYSSGSHFARREFAQSEFGWGQPKRLAKDVYHKPRVRLIAP